MCVIEYFAGISKSFGMHACVLMLLTTMSYVVLQVGKALHSPRSIPRD